MKVFSLDIWRRDSGKRVGYCENCGCWVLIDQRTATEYTCHFCQTEYDVYVVNNKNKKRARVVILPTRNIHEEIGDIFKDLERQGRDIFIAERGII